MKSFSYFLHLLFFSFVILATGCKKDGDSPDKRDAPRPGDSIVLYPKTPRVEGALPFDIKLVRAMDGRPHRIGGWSYEDRSQAGTQEIVAENWTIDNKWFSFKSILAFPYISSPENIKSAYLVLHSHESPGEGNKVDANSGANNAFYVRRINIDWDVYNPQNVKSDGPIFESGTTTEDQVLVPHTNLKRLDVTIDVTAMMKKMGNVSQSAYMMGLMIELQDKSKSYNTRMFYSNASAPSYDFKPRLVITY